MVSNRLRRYRRFKDARAFAQSLGLASGNAWNELCRSGQLPVDIPANPRGVYRTEGWAGYGDWLGTGIAATFLREYRPFEEARPFARDQNLRSGEDWRKFTKSGRLPADIPANPRGVYEGKGWAGMGDWLGTGNVANNLRQFRPFEEAREFVRGLRLNSKEAWSEFAKSAERPDDIPANPRGAYKDKGWVS